MTSFDTITSSQLAYERKFADQYIKLASVEQDEISGLFTPERDFKGEGKFLNYIGTTEARRKTREFERTQYSFIEHTRRFMTHSKIYDAVPIDDYVSWQMIADPKSGYQQRVLEAMNRMRAEDALSYFFGDVLAETRNVETGQVTTTTLSFPNANKIAFNYSGAFAQTGTGLTFDKLFRANQLAFAQAVPLNKEPFTIIMDYTTWLGFLSQRIDTGADDVFPSIDMKLLLSEGMKLQPGESMNMGPWRFVIAHQTITSGDDILVPAFYPSGMRKGTGPKTTEFNRIAGTVDSREILVTEINGFLRSEDEKVYQIAVRNS